MSLCVCLSVAFKLLNHVTNCYKSVVNIMVTLGASRHLTLNFLQSVIKIWRRGELLRCEPHLRAVTDILHTAVDREELCRFCEGAIFTECEIARWRQYICLLKILFVAVMDHWIWARGIWCGGKLYTQLHIIWNILLIKGFESEIMRMCEFIIDKFIAHRILFMQIIN